jgi:3-oxo-5-alpha-steroid 4-dehydrogenase 3
LRCGGAAPEWSPPRSHHIRRSSPSSGGPRDSLLGCSTVRKAHMLSDVCVVLVRAYFLLTSLAVLIVWAVPPLHRAFIPYGKTLTGSRKPKSLLQWLANITVPKAWFWHYYLLSVALSLFWGGQIVGCSWGSSLCVLKWFATVDGRTMLLWGMMFVQGCRRLHEMLYVQKFSSAKMWIGHYLIGLAFYFMMNLAVLVDGSPIPKGSILFDILIIETSIMRSVSDAMDKHTLSAVSLFVTASIWQYNVHSMLASLRPRTTAKPTYTSPPESSVSFQLFLTPHYTAEILIYLSMALLSRNWTMFSALLWVTVDLSVSAAETRQWADTKFRGSEWGRWNLIPYVY